MSQFDPIELEAIWGRLVSAANEMGATLLRTAVSSSARLNGDFTCAVFDARGRMLSQLVQAGAAHLGGMLTIVPALYRRFPAETLVPGDVLITNDPWLGCGHTPDIYLFTPVFYRQRLVGLTGTCIHHQDLGGRPTPTESRDVFEEGLIIPVARFYRAGELNEDIYNTIQANVRFPDLVLGDIRSQLAANHVGATRLIELLEDYDLEDLLAVGDTILARTTRALRDLLAQIPSGTYQHEIFIDRLRGDGTGRLRLAVKLEVADGKIVVDLAGTSPQVDEPINSVPNVTRAYILHGVRLATNVEVPNNVGTLDVIEIRAPEATILSARWPAPVYWRLQSALHLPEAILRALGSAIAGSSPHWFITLNGEWPNGRRFISWAHWAAGMGARPDRDGRFACFPADVADLPVEVLENEAAVLVERRELAADSGGPGRFRGGCGQRITVRPLPADAGEPTKPLLITAIGHWIAEPPPGIHGGLPGARGQMRLDDRPLPGSRTQVFLDPGDSITLIMAGGGGYGPPWERDPIAVRDDVLDGLVTIESARTHYGVVLDPATTEIDHAATEQLRRATRAAASG